MFIVRIWIHERGKLSESEALNMRAGQAVNNHEIPPNDNVQ